MISTVKLKSFDLPAADIAETARYSGGKTSEEAVGEILAEVGKIGNTVCYAEFPVKLTDGVLDLGFTRVTSKDLAKNLEDCKSVVVFAATVGFGFDRLISKYSVSSLTKSVYAAAVGAERIEALCDAFCDHLKAEKAGAGLKTKPRFSPGYGDLPLDLQRDIFSALDVTKMIGVTLGESLCLMPSKSVTAIVGIY